jgi:enoyl-CoA hydratase/carnithine racemase
MTMLQMQVDGAVATLTLCRAPVNAISAAWVRAFEQKLDALASGSSCTVVHIRSDQKAFCAGADLNEVRAHLAGADGADRIYAFVAGIQRLYARIEALPQVTVAEIGGAAMGGGLELTLACDLRVAALEARLGLPEARLGLIPGAGGTQRLTRLCGRATAARLILGAEVVDGAGAQSLGLVHWAVPRADLARRAVEIVRGVAALPAAALAASKACIAAAGWRDRSGYGDELEFTRALLNDPDTRRRVDAFLAGDAGVSRHTNGGAAP